jgi:hypothetical protein
MIEAGRPGDCQARNLCSPQAKLHLPSEFSMTLGLPDSMTATQELVVPRSIPTMLKNADKVNVSNEFSDEERGREDWLSSPDRRR